MYSTVFIRKRAYTLSDFGNCDFLHSFKTLKIIKFLEITVIHMKSVAIQCQRYSTGLSIQQNI